MEQAVGVSGAFFEAQPCFEACESGRPGAEPRGQGHRAAPLPVPAARASRPLRRESPMAPPPPPPRTRLFFGRSAPARRRAAPQPRSSRPRRGGRRRGHRPPALRRFAPPGTWAQAGPWAAPGAPLPPPRPRRSQAPPRSRWGRAAPLLPRQCVPAAGPAAHPAAARRRRGRGAVAALPSGPAPPRQPMSALLPQGALERGGARQLCDAEGGAGGSGGWGHGAVPGQADAAPVGGGHRRPAAATGGLERPSLSSCGSGSYLQKQYCFSTKTWEHEGGAAVGRFAAAPWHCRARPLPVKPVLTPVLDVFARGRR